MHARSGGRGAGLHRCGALKRLADQRQDVSSGSSQQCPSGHVAAEALADTSTEHPAGLRVKLSGFAAVAVAMDKPG